ncbi:MAG TPA: uroporphyrinogen-III synthase, partial [Ktedonobacteraceae bacterium]|nr:uroporphyrinogen-III synthase [Ktedonobacteraceae bacterium]
MYEMEKGDHKAILAGRRVLVTRAAEQAGVLSERLRALGAIPVEFPTIRIVPPSNWELLDEALRRVTKASTKLAGRVEGRGRQRGKGKGRAQGIAP